VLLLFISKKITKAATALEMEAETELSIRQTSITLTKKNPRTENEQKQAGSEAPDQAARRQRKSHSFAGHIEKQRQGSSVWSFDTQINHGLN